jgi:hypothetical protein
LMNIIINIEIGSHISIIHQIQSMYQYEEWWGKLGKGTGDGLT